MLALLAAKYPNGVPENWDAVFPDLAPFCNVVLGDLVDRIQNRQNTAKHNQAMAQFGVEYVCLRYLGAGERDFAVARSLGEALALTDSGDVLTEDVRLPFSCARLLVPPGLFSTWSTYGGAGKWDRVHSIFVYSYTDTDAPRAIAIMTVAVAEDGDHANEKPAFIPVVPGQRLEDVFNTIRTMQSKAMFARTATGETGRDALARMFGWVCNVLLYITAPGADVKDVPIPSAIARLREQAAKHPKGSHKRERAQAALRKTREESPQPNVRSVGTSIKIPGWADVSAEDRARALAGGRQYKTAWHQRGHWRRQHHGVGWQSATEAGHHAVWIKPQIKRRDLGEVVKRTYAVLSADDREKR
jgi:hypothetical protein